MAGAIIVADQNTGAGAGSPGLARNDLWLGQVVDLYVGTGGNTSYLWELLDKPVASAAVLTAPATAFATSFTPDAVGTYRVRLTTNGGGIGNVQTLVLRVRYDATGELVNRGWAYPAFGEISPEANYGTNARGWGEVLESIFDNVLSSLESVPALASLPVTITTTVKKNRIQDYDPSGGTFSLKAPLTPARGDRFGIVNATDDTTAITVDGNGKNIVNPSTKQSVASFSYNEKFGCLSYVYDGSKWLLLSAT